MIYEIFQKPETASHRVQAVLSHTKKKRESTQFRPVRWNFLLEIRMYV
jgi:hypothetical protein